MKSVLLRIGWVALFLWSCSGPRLQGPPGQQFEVWTTPASNGFITFPSRLVRLSLTRTLTSNEVEHAAEGLNIRVSEMSFATPHKGDGEVRCDNLLAVPDALDSVGSLYMRYNYKVLGAAEISGYFERTVGKVRLSRGKQVYTLRFSDLPNRRKMLGAFQTSAELRKALYDFTGRVASDLDTQAVLEKRIAFIYGIVLEPNSLDVLTFAQRVGAVGATPTQVNSYVSVQGKFPVALAQSRARFTALKPDKPYVSALYTYLLELMEEFKLTPKP